MNKIVISSVIAVVLSVSGISGCAKSPHYDDYRRVDGFRDVYKQASATSTIDNPNDRAMKMAANNRKSLDLFRNEWQYNKIDKSTTPKLGLALSGGGIRSATFSIGVMKGLTEIGILDSVDVMSSVSGGGYAMSWYFLQQYYSNKKVDSTELFDEAGRFQRYLATHGELIGHTDKNVVRKIEYGIKVVPTWVVSVPVNIFSNLLFGWHANVTPLRWMYQNGIERAYHLVPTTNDGKETLNDYSPLWIQIGVKEQAPIKDVGKFALEKKLPYFIVNATANMEDVNFKKANYLASAVFEFTPVRYGSDYYGYIYESDAPISLNKAISISGAAVDSRQVNGFVEQILLSGLNFDQGYYIGNFTPAIVSKEKMGLTPNISDNGMLISNILPLPLYPFSGSYQKDIKGNSIYLSDGGHSENLGAFSLIRRLCGTIIIVDAEHDPEYKFGSYFKLKDALQSQMGVELTVNDIDIIKTDLTRLFNHSTPVMLGQVESFPLEENGKIVKKTLQVVYIKLSIENEHSDDPHYYSDTIVRYNALHKNDSGGLIFTSYPFPQQGTDDQSFDEEQFLAYRDLGYLIVASNAKKICEATGLTCHESASIKGIDARRAEVAVSITK